MLVMATGTGKTYTAFQIIWRLWKDGIKKRILFLADRTALISQTFTNDFAPFKDKMTWATKQNFDTAYEIYLGLYQGLTGEDKDANSLFKQFSPNFFDLIVVDECHRGSAKADSQWREVLEYFTSATQIGLTATPKETKEVSNIDYFGDPVYTYTLKQGINDGYLGKFELQGVRKAGVCSFCLVNITNEVIIILIKQTRINSCNCFAAAVPGTPVRLRVEDVGRFEGQLRAFGFKETDENGTTILPSGVNRYAKKNQHVTPHPQGGWQVKGAGNQRATVRTETQAEARAIAREIAINNRSELVVHGTDGCIREKNSYGNDSCPPKG